MSKNSNIKLISASIDDELLLVELMKKYHLYDGIEMTDEDRLAALRPLLSSSERATFGLFVLAASRLDILLLAIATVSSSGGLRSGLMNFISMNSAEDRDLAVRF